MRATEHYAEAEKVLRLIASGEADTETEEDRAAAVAIAQVHATLALAGATALQSYARIGDDTELDDWQAAAGGPRSDCACGRPVDVAAADEGGRAVTYVDDAGFWHKDCADAARAAADQATCEGGC